MESRGNETIQVGEWLVRPALNELERNGESLRAEPKTVEVLVFLARRAGMVVSADELVAGVWGGRFIGDSPVYRIIAELRRILGDDARQPRYIETIRKRGYRLIAKVQDAAAPPPTPDTTTAGGLPADLEIVRPLGQGSMAQVVLGRDRALERLVAIKMLRPEFAGDSVAIRRFAREAKAAARIRHPNVTAIDRVGTLDDGLPYLVMEYIDGKNLHDARLAAGTFDIATARRMLAQIAAGLAAAHEQGVVHRDVTPANILWRTSDGQVLLTDFGFAAIRESGSATVTRLTREGELVGDLTYLSPERITGGHASEYSDVYSLGVIAWELLTGAGPYRDVDARDPGAAHLAQAPRALADARPDVPPEMADVLTRCLAKSPALRPRAGDVMRGLRAG
ncbi:MAG: protein kinase [Pseudomonadota bacterium]